MWYNGLLDLSVWQLVLVTLLLTHITIISVTVYLHRFSAHRALDLHPALQHFFRFWLWLTTGQNTREWTAIHRKHHAKCETSEDPHSPQVLGLFTVLRRGAELYQDEAKNQQTLDVYGKNCPDDWMERNVYSRYTFGGIVVMAVLDLLLFGALGMTIWAIQMVWIPFWAAGVINGIGHFFGYRNFECSDAATNISPWGILIGGEELHNNHHTYPNSAKLSVKPWEFDLGWAYIQLFSALGLAKVKRTTPIAHRVEGKRSLDLDTVMAIANNRFQVMAEFRRTVIAPLVQTEKLRLEDKFSGLGRSAKRLLARETSLLDARHKMRLDTLFSRSDALKQVYEKRLALQTIWTERRNNAHEMLEAMRQWIADAENSGNQALQAFAEQLKSYSLRPAVQMG
ncbi:DesA family fatty acid desaturase [Atopomonas sediminilitoris]|uniref:DesA family fatty acid desaturase n=1 Tax=Atopomonas sediminilitoris TaxID=2919919 RepID=UPI001F4DF18A|nr:acyl-CoA desaturase [Atopomonas sediminilitoris]MCJ8169381.1 fatty acid desaturase [Atopomonas sediminilitoris]